MKFKKGDRVKFVGIPKYSFDVKGNMGTVIGLHSSAVDPLWIIEIDGVSPPSLSEGWTYFESGKLWEKVEGVNELKRNAIYSMEKEDVEKFLEIAEADGIVWSSGKKPTKINPSGTYNDLAFHIDNYGEMMYCSLRFYQIEDEYRGCDFIEFNACEDELEEEEVEEAKYGVGDELVIEDEFYGHGFRVGEIVTVLEICRDYGLTDSREVNYLVENKYYEGGYVDETEVSLKSNEPKFKVGDRITGTPESDGVYGITNSEMYVGIVDQIGIDGEIYVIVDEHKDDWVIGEAYWVNSKYFELIDEEEPTFTTEEVADILGISKDDVVTAGADIERVTFKVGDLVRGIDPDKYGITNTDMKVGEILFIHGDGGMTIKIVDHVKSHWIDALFDVLPEFFELINPESKEDMVNHPKHYTKGGIETLDFILAKAKDLPPEEAVLFGHIIRYVTRYRDKFNAVEDLNKAEFYLKKLIEIVEGSDE